MKLTNTKLAHGLILGLAVILTGSSAEAGHYRDIDDHSRDIEREAERAEAIVKYNFRHAPVTVIRCLQDSLCAMAQTAHQLHDLTDCEGNVHAFASKVDRLDAQFCEVQDGFLALRGWVTGSGCSISRFGYVSCSARPSRTDELQLKSLCRRIDDIEEELDCMKKELREVLAHHSRHLHDSHGHASHRHSSRSVSRGHVDHVRPIIPLGTYGRPGHDHSRDRHGRSGSYFGSRDFGYSRHSGNSYIHTRIGGFGLSFRLK